MGEESEDAEEHKSPMHLGMQASPPSAGLKVPTANTSTSAEMSVISPAADETLATPHTLRSNGDLRSPRTPASETSEGWSAVGKATISGRSGRVIERLQSDLDQAKRDNKALKLNYDELHSSYGFVAAEVESLRSSVETNESIVSTVKAQMSRKERKIKDLKEDLVQERTRRETAEAAQASILAETERRVMVAERDCCKAEEVAKHHQTQYEVVARSLQQLRNEYERKVKKLSATSNNILETIVEDQQKISEYEASVEHFRACSERASRMSDEVVQEYERYRVARDDDVANLTKQLEEYRNKMKEMEKEVTETVGSMRHVMNIKATYKGRFNDPGKDQ